MYNGVVGTKGITQPIVPTANAKRPANTKIYLRGPLTGPFMGLCALKLSMCYCLKKSLIVNNGGLAGCIGDIAKEKNPQGMTETAKVAKQGGGVAKAARKEYELHTGKEGV